MSFSLRDCVCYKVDRIADACPVYANKQNLIKLDTRGDLCKFCTIQRPR